MEYYGNNDFRDYILAHHGILGMQWGKRNGPPYPIGSSGHSASEKKAGWRKSLGGGRNEHLYDRKSETKSVDKPKKSGLQLTDKQKKALKIGAIAAGVTLAAVGTVYLARSGRLQVIGKQFSKAGGNGFDRSKLDGVLNGVYTKNPNFVHDIEKDFKTINPSYKAKEGFKLLSDMPDKAPLDRVNCVACTTSYDLKCRGYDGVIAQLTDTRKMPFNQLMQKVYKNPVIEAEGFKDWKDLSKTLRKQGRFARGNLVVPFQGGGSHSIAYEIDKRGRVWFIDAQAGEKFKSIKELSDFLVLENGGDPRAGISSIAMCEWIRTDNLELNDINAITTLVAGK